MNKQSEIRIAKAVAPGFGGNVAISLKIQDNRILECEAEGTLENSDKAKVALAELPKKIVEANSPEVDAICGATVTSNAITNAAKIAYNKLLGKDSGIHMKPGKYTACSMGYWGIWELPVTITVNETSLLKIEVPLNDRFAHGETEVLLESVQDKLFPRMIENQSVMVDAIAGATVSSNAVKSAVQKALKQALVEGGSDESAISYFYSVPNKEDEGIVEEKDVDILVLGLGNGGIFGMVSAMERMQELNGRKRVSILALEKAGKVGGNSHLTHEANAVNPPRYMAEYYPGQTFVNKEEYLNAWLKYTTTKSGKQSAKEELVKLYIEESGKVIDWLHYEHGWQFGSMELSPCQDFEAWSAYNTVLRGNQDTGTNEDRRKILTKYYNAMLSKVESQGGEYLLETEAYEYIMDGDKVVGVKARNNVTGREYIIKAKAIIQGCGGFASNNEMLTNLLDPQFAGPRKVTNTGVSDGKMLKAALDIGAGTWNIGMSPIVMMKGLPHYLKKYPIEFLDGRLNGRTGRYETWTLNDIPLGMGVSSDIMCVDREGKRYGNEALFSLFSLTIDKDSWPSFKSGPYYWAIYSQPQVDYLREHGFTAISRWDGYCSQGGVPAGRPLPEIDECLQLCIDEGMAWKADSIEELAKKIDVSAENLCASVARYNEIVENKKDDDFGKPDKFLTLKTEGGPYYAIKIMNVIFATAGGLDVDTQMRVLRQDHKTPIEGLYANGSDCLGVVMNEERNYVGFGGVAQGWVYVSGRLAGINAADYVFNKYGFKENPVYLVDVEAYTSTK